MGYIWPKKSFTVERRNSMKCPGQDSRYWKPGAIFEAKCPECGHAVEFFKDDTTRLCKKCGHRFLNPDMDFGCASYCKYAEQCILFQALKNCLPEIILRIRLSFSMVQMKFNLSVTVFTKGDQFLEIIISVIVRRKEPGPFGHRSGRIMVVVCKQRISQKQLLHSSCFRLV